MAHHADKGAPPPDYAPPGYDGASPHNWQTAVPDTALLPPPPALFSGWERSPANNATEDQADAGEAWCEENPLAAPMPLDSADDGDAAAARAALASHNIGLLKTDDFRGELAWVQKGLWRGRTTGGSSSPDSCLLSYPPLYAAASASAAATTTAYYEVHITADNGHGEVGLALGFAAPPYPAFRLPGWHRGSLAVHGDDGHRYVNDTWGGKSFAQPFRRGETYGLGIMWGQENASSGGRRSVNVFFTRNGRLAGGWDLYEETDAEQDRPVTGLEGGHDLCAAIGTFGQVGFEVRFAPELWAYRG